MSFIGSKRIPRCTGDFVGPGVTGSAKPVPATDNDEVKAMSEASTRRLDESARAAIWSMLRAVPTSLLRKAYEQRIEEEKQLVGYGPPTADDVRIADEAAQKLIVVQAAQGQAMSDREAREALAVMGEIMIDEANTGVLRALHAQGFGSRKPEIPGEPC